MCGAAQHLEWAARRDFVRRLPLLLVCQLFTFAAVAQTAIDSRYPRFASASYAADARSLPRAAGPETPVDLETLIGLRQLDRAIEMGTQIVESARKEHGDDSRALADAYMDLARAQRFAGKHSDAEASYLAAIDIYRKLDGYEAAAVIEPMTELGNNYYEAGQFEESIAAFTEARNLQHREFGLLNTDQIDLMNRTTESLVGMGRYEDALHEQRDVKDLIERIYPPGSPEMLEGIYDYMNALLELDRPRRGSDRARAELQRAINAVREEDGEDSPLVAQAHRAMAALGGDLGRIKVELRLALEVAEAQDPPDPMMVASALMDLGDLDILVGEEGSKYYLRAWDALEPLDNADRVRVAWFAPSATTVRWDAQDLPGPSDDLRIATSGTATVYFSVDKRSRPVGITLVRRGAPPSNLLDIQAAASLQRSRFETRVALTAQGQRINMPRGGLENDPPTVLGYR